MTAPETVTARVSTADIGRVVLHGHLRRCLEGTDRFSSSEGLALLRRDLLAPPEVGPMVVQAARVTSLTVVVAVDVGKTEFAFSVTDATRTSLLKPRTGCPMTGPSLSRVVSDIVEVLPVS